MDPLSHSTLNEGHIKWLRRLVTSLTIVMIGGVVTIIVLLFSQINQSSTAPVPAGFESLLTKDTIAYSVTAEWIITTSKDGQITVYAAQDQTEVARFDIPN